MLLLFFFKMDNLSWALKDEFCEQRPSLKEVTKCNVEMAKKQLLDTNYWQRFRTVSLLTTEFL